jgi:tetrahydromethanopterin S-methyltransferase subunit B
VEVSYGMQWVGYNLFKHLVDPITKTKIGFKAFNDYIVENIPKWSEKIATWLSKVVTLATDALRPLEKLKEMFSDLWKVMTPGEKTLAALIGAGGLFAISGPFGRAVVLISGLILLINDFYSHLRGGKSLMGDWWDKWLEGLKIASFKLYALSRYIGAIIDVFGGKKYAAQALNELSGKSGMEKMRREWEENQATISDTKKPYKPAYYVEPKVGTQAEIFNAAQEVSKKTGIPASLVYGRWYFETGGFTNRGAQELNNLSGIKIPGGRDYRGFKSLSEFANYEASLIQKSYPGAMGAQTPEALTKGLAGGKLGSWAESMMTPEGMAAYTAGTNKGQDIYHIIYDIKAPITIDGSLGNARDIAKEVAQTAFDIRFAAKGGRY